MKRPFLHAGWAIAVALGLLPAPALAQPADEPSADQKATAEALFNEAKKLVAQGKLSEACPKFAASQSLDAGVGTLMYLSDCYERNGQTASAWASWLDAARAAKAATQPDREQVARTHAAALEPKLSKLVILVPPSNDSPTLEVKRDKRAVDRAVWGTPSPIDPGKHSVEASAPSRNSWASTVDIAAGATVTVTVPTLEVETPSTGPLVQNGGNAESGPGTTVPIVSGQMKLAEGSNKDAPPPTSTGSSQRTAGYVATGVGVVGLGLGGYFALVRGSKMSERESVCPALVHCTDSDVTRNETLSNDARRAATLATAGFIAGGVVVAGGLVLVLSAPSRQATRGMNLRLLPVVSQRGPSAVLEGTW